MTAEEALCSVCGHQHQAGADCQGPALSRIGEVIAGKYRLERRLSSGGMGEVYEAKHLLLGRRFAVKLLLPRYADQGEMLARFQLEAKAAGMLESEHIAAVTDFGFANDGAPYLLMEYLDGEDLAHLLARTGPLSPGRAVDLVMQACRGLALAHRHGIIHRDLKPENLFVLARSDRSELLKILDFGIAKLREPVDESGRGEEKAGTRPGEDSRGLASSATELGQHGTREPANLGVMTRSGIALGTPCYMSPEQARGDRAIDQRTDIYSLGVILYELLSGQKPHVAEGYNAILFHILTQPPTPLAQLRQDLPIGLAEVVANAMAFDRDSRYASVLDLADALRPFAIHERAIPATGKTAASKGPRARTVPETPLNASETARPTRPGRGKAKLVWLAGLALTLVAVGVFVHQTGRKAASPSAATSVEKSAPAVLPTVTAEVTKPPSAAATPDEAAKPVVAPAVPAAPPAPTAQKPIRRQTKAAPRVRASGIDTEARTKDPTPPRSTLDFDLESPYRK
jgi:eukaryotic-like serine/threonine-protein kinase